MKLFVPFVVLNWIDCVSVLPCSAYKLSIKLPPADHFHACMQVIICPSKNAKKAKHCVNFVLEIISQSNTLLEEKCLLALCMEASLLHFNVDQAI